MTISKFISNTLISLTFVAFVAQLIIDFSTINIATSCIILTSSVSTLLYFRWSKAFDSHPLSSFAIIGFCLTSILGAMLAQSGAWTAVSKDLYQPIFTFSMLAMYQAIALLAHGFYRMVSSTSTKHGLLRSTFQAMGIYATPGVLNLWIIGLMGLFFVLLANISPVARGLSFLAWAPFLIPIYLQQMGPNYCNAKKNYILLFMFTILVGLVAMAFNARAMMLSGIATVALLFFLIGLRSDKLVSSKMLFRMGILLVLGVTLSWPVSNMVTAMAIARADRGKVSGAEMVTKTLENFQKQDKIDSFRKEVLSRELQSSYDEGYIKNPFVARFVITQFHDNAMYFASKVSDKGAEQVTSISGDFFWATLPQPILDALKIDVNKDKMYFSMGDVLVNLAVGIPLGGQKTGSVFGQGWVMFGVFFSFIYFFMCLVLFIALDLFSIRTTVGKVELAVIGMLNVWPNFLFGITADSLHYLFIGVVRGVIQSVLLYSIVFAISKVVSGLITMLMHKKPMTISSLAVK
ncbi:hypothetical protein [Methylotenera sp.]|uniref:hypothetical protein n=1 Tax=Methylotenera sp. TaxID=2051956 RepID=UPI00248A1D18|nr:hypothetical protein [Methylotenera sp.]MDI1299024.1 hypothetical protein [Methylotenera sp.]